MKYAKLVHNPTAGEGEHSKKKLITEIERAGYSCSYSSTKEKGWEKIIDDKTDLLIVAGGDGTVRKSAAELLNRKVIDKKFPLAVLPYGTANNIARTLGLSENNSETISSWANGNLKKFDVGRVHRLKDAEFFLESFGFGVFPELIHTMREFDHSLETPEEKLDKALEELEKIVDSYPAKHARLIIDGIEHEGNFLLCEIMNTRSVGPNLDLAPDADPGDGEFDVVLIREDQRKELAEFVRHRVKGSNKKPLFTVIRAKKILITIDESLFHEDDELVETDKSTEICIEIYPAAIDFLV